MGSVSRRWVLLLSLAGLLVPLAAQADEQNGTFAKDDWPLQTIKRPLTLAGGMLEIRGDSFGINLSADKVAKPMFIAPDLYYGVDEKFTVGVTHEEGFCLGGTSGGCLHAYNDLGVEAQYSLMRAGSMQVAGHAAILVPALQSLKGNLIAGLTAGLTTRITGGSIAVVLDPGLYLGVIGRDEPITGAAGPKETVEFPVAIQYQANTQSMVFLSTGLFGALSNFGSNYVVPIGLGASFAANNRLDLGAEIRLIDPIAGTGSTFDNRELLLRLALRI